MIKALDSLEFLTSSRNCKTQVVVEKKNKKKKKNQGFFLIGNVVLDLHHIQIGIIKQLEMQIFFVYIVSLKEVSLF